MLELRLLGLQRRRSLVVPVAIAQAQANLRSALQTDIILQGNWQLTRRYWGQVDVRTVTLHGPQAQRQFCFLTRGQLNEGEHPGETRLVLDITLGRASQTQLAGAIAFLIIALTLVLHLWGMILLPVFLGFLYGMTQWHFTHYAKEIERLLRQCLQPDS